MNCTVIFLLPKQTIFEYFSPYVSFISILSADVAKGANYCSVINAVGIVVAHY